MIRARTLEVSLSRDDGGIEVLFGECELNIGDEPNKQAAIDAALAAPEPPNPAPAVVTTKAPRRKGGSEAWDAFATGSDRDRRSRRSAPRPHPGSGEDFGTRGDRG